MLGNYIPDADMIKKSLHLLIGSSFFFSGKIFTWINICNGTILVLEEMMQYLVCCTHAGIPPGSNVEIGDFLLILPLDDIGFCVQYVEPFL